MSKFFKIHKLNGNKLKGNQNIWEATKAVPTGKFIARNATLDKREHRKVPTTKIVKRATYTQSKYKEENSKDSRNQ